MFPDKAPVVAAETTMGNYRKEYNANQKEFWSRENLPILRKQYMGIEEVIIGPRSVDMRDYNGDEDEMRRAIETLYASIGGALDPTIPLPPSMIDNYGKEYALNARGIYYIDDFSPRLVTVDRKVWVPSFEGIDWKNSGESDRRRRARIIMDHSIDNETRHKSEYAWEADAWADVFSPMRNDPCLEVDKHDYLTRMPKTHPILCTLTGDSKVVNRIPDATFGLATFSQSTRNSEVQADELDRERLEKLLLHPKCGLLCDPKWGETDLVFPFAVYEAKGWSGDCREARRQACQAGACYLDMLDNLARTPGPVGSPKVYQTKTSHQYQIFALTSFGAHWHLLVGYQRPRQVKEYAGREGFSKTVYMFQRIWSGRLTNEREAWELLSLIDQIHLWAITEFRTFIIEHLKPWHKFCDENYLLDWKSVYNVKSELKHMRNPDEDEDLSLPSWCNTLNESLRRKLQIRAKRSLAETLENRRLRKGKGRCKRSPEPSWCCGDDDCSNSSERYTPEGFINHLGAVHHYPEEELAKIRRCLGEAEEKSIPGERLVILRDGDEREDVESAKNKRGLDEEEGSINLDSSQCIPSPSKRMRVL